MDPMDEDPAPVVVEGEAVRFGAVRLGAAEMVQAGIAAGNIYRQAADAEVLALPEASSAHRQEQQQVVEEIELRRKMKSLVVPTVDADVRRLLRQMGEPITLFGERQMERRERLRKLLALMDEDQALAFSNIAEKLGIEQPAAPPTNELFYTEGPPELKVARIEIAQFSLKRAGARLAAAKQELEDADGAATVGSVDQPLERKLKLMTNHSSEVADERPVVACQFSPDGSQLATGAWSGTLKVWSLPDCRKGLTVKAHADRITGLAWHPAASSSGRGDDALALATGATDCTARLWSPAGKLLRTLSGHSERLGRIAFHPMGRHLGTASFDLTWRLWDVETGQCLVEQEGHSRAVYAVAFQRDGALAASGGMDAYGRVWDVRTGRSIMVLEGHVKSVLAVDFSPNGHLVATGSEDNTARVYDLRKKGVLAVLPGHTSLVSQVRFDPAAGTYLLTSGYDGVSKLWCGPRFKLAKTLAGHEGKVMASDVSPDGSFLVASAGYDRTLKLWQPDGLMADAEH